MPGPATWGGAAAGGGKLLGAVQPLHAGSAADAAAVVRMRRQNGLSWNRQSFNSRKPAGLPWPAAAALAPGGGAGRQSRASFCALPAPGAWCSILATQRPAGMVEKPWQARQLDRPPSRAPGTALQPFERL